MKIMVLMFTCVKPFDFIDLR